MELVLKVEGQHARRLLILVGFVIFLALLGWMAKTQVAYELSRKPTLKSLERAVRLDPGNAAYHLALGRLYQYSVADINPERALQEFQRAARLSPHDPQPWLEWAAALQLQGKVSDAGWCLGQADSLAPNSPAVQWPIANFYLLRGNVDEAFRHFKVVLAGSSQYNQIVFRIAWKASEDADKILNELIPRRLPTELSYLYYLLAEQRFQEAQAVWKRIVDSSEEFTLPQVIDYVNALLGARRPEEAYSVWTDLERKGLIRSSEKGLNESLIADGDFEDEPVNMGFAWRVVPVEGAYGGLDTTTYHSPGRALLIQFSGTHNLSYEHAFEYVKVWPKRSYHLQAFIKTEGITTDSGPRLEVRDVYDYAALRVYSEDLRGSTDGWHSTSLDFTTGPKTQLLFVGLVRWPSRKLDNLIAGKVWLDDVRLYETTK